MRDMRAFIVLVALVFAGCPVSIPERSSEDAPPGDVDGSGRGMDGASADASVGRDGGMDASTDDPGRRGDAGEGGSDGRGDAGEDGSGGSGDAGHRLDASLLDSGEGQTCVAQDGLECAAHQVCDGTVLASTDSFRCCGGSCRLPRTFDWRHRHGENWNSPVKDQNPAATCRTFAPVAALEAQVNLHYNQHVDLDLSEQMLEDCLFMDFMSTEYVCHSANGYDLTWCKLERFGLPDEACDPYDARLSGAPEENHCTSQHVCADWQSRAWKIASSAWYDIYNDPVVDYPGRVEASYPQDVQRYLITRGPMESGLISWNHAMTIVGYETDDDGVVSWIFKNSWGPSAGDHGYVTVTPGNATGVTDLIIPNHPVGPFTPPANVDYWPAKFTNAIRCVDLDDDGDCNWGVSELKPATCPSACAAAPDWDDSDPTVGALGTY